MPRLFTLWSNLLDLPAKCDSSDGTPKTGITSLMNNAGLGGFMGKLIPHSIKNDKESPVSQSIVSSPPVISNNNEQLQPAVPLENNIQDHSLSSLSPHLQKDLLPIQFEQFSKEYMQMTGQDTFDGFRLEAGKPVTPYLQANHSLFLGTSMRDTGCLYQFGPTFGLEDGSMLLMGRYSNDGAMTARGLKKLGQTLEGRISASSVLGSPQRNMLEVSLDKTGKDWAASTKAAWQGTWILNSTFSQIIAPNLHMGGDMTWIAANGATIGSIGLRYLFGPHIISGLLTRQPNFKSRLSFFDNSHSGKLQYFNKVSDRLSLGAELEISREKPNTDSALRFGYEYLFRQARIQGLFDTAGKIAIMAQDASGFGISGAIDFWKNDYRFGFMMQVIPPPPEISGINNETATTGMTDTTAMGHSQW